MASRARTHPRIPYQYCAHQPHTHAHTRSVTYICPEDDLPQNNTNGRGGKNGDLGPKPTSLSTEGTFYLRACCARVARVVTFKRYAFPKTARAAPIGQIPFAALARTCCNPALSRAWYREVPWSLAGLLGKNCATNVFNWL